VYCECGKTTLKTLERKPYTPTYKVLEEIDDYLSQNPKLDYVTFSGSGEPTLHKDIGRVALYIKTKYPQYKLALLTNGTLLTEKKVRDAILCFDLIKISLDAVSDIVFKKVNRGMPGMDNQSIIKGIIRLRKEFKGQIWLEIFIIPSINDGRKELILLKEAIRTIKPDKVQLNSLDRPGTEKWVKVANKKSLEQIANFLGNVEVIARFPAPKKADTKNKDITESILTTIKRRPCTLEDLSQSLGLPVGKIKKEIDRLLKIDKIISEKGDRGKYFRMK
jgi:wyosine [tRNA(Phe)-imidazoG37] synthetase (radical SAM superfamily)